MLTYTSLIILDRWPVIQTQLITMQKKAFKLGLQPITYNWSAVKSPVYIYEDNEGIRYSSDVPPDGKRRFTGMVLDRIEVVVSGTMPVLNGWRFVAKLAPTEDRKANLLLTVPNYSNEKLLPYVEKVGVCEHCNTTRYRKDTFVVEHEDGTIKAVGRQCLADFIGGQTPEQLLKYGESFFDIPSLIRDADSDYYNGPHYNPSVSLRAFLAGTVRYIEEYGWVSRAETNDYGGLSTSDLVWCHFCSRRVASDGPLPIITEEDYTKADEVINWMSGLGGNSEYFTNLRTLSTQETVSTKSRGLVASAAHVYRRQCADKASEAHKDEHFGIVGQRYTIVVRLLFLRVIEGYYGNKCIHKFRTKEGHTLTWFATSGKWMDESDMERDCTIEFRVKGHEMYEGKKQTIVSHVKFDGAKPE